MIHTEKSVQHEYEKVSVQECVSDKEDVPPKYGFGVRHMQLAIILLCLMVNIMGRGHMGVSIVAMTDYPKDKTTVITLNITKGNDTEEVLNNLAEDELVNNITSGNQSAVEAQSRNITTTKTHTTFQWPKSVQEMVLNSFFLGYSLMMFPMGLVVQRYGGKLPLQIALFINSIASIITPWLTIWGGWKAVCACRIIQGLSQAGTYPCVQTLLAKWASVNELASLSSYVYTGTLVGTVVAYPMAGFLAESQWGWPSTFYTYGVIAFLCFTLLTVFGAASPMDHKSISDIERKYIIGPCKDGKSRVVEGKLKTPWRAMATSKPLWGLFIAQCGSNFSFIFFFNQVPTYIHNILGINVKNSGILSSLPYIASFFTAIGFGWLSDYLYNNKYVSLTNARRIFNTIAQVGLAVPLIGASYTNNNAVAVTCLVVAMATHVAVHAGWMVNHIDLAPNFSGTMMATSATVSMTFYLSLPVIVSYVVTDTTNVVQWRIMFCIIAAVCIISDAIFIFMVSTDVQPWNYADFNETCCEKANVTKKEVEEESHKTETNHSEIPENT